MEHFLLNLLKLSAIGGLVIAAALLTRPLWRERYRAKTRRALWLVLALLLLLPLDYSLPAAPLRVAAPADHTLLITQEKTTLVRTETFFSEQAGELMNLPDAAPQALRDAAVQAHPGRYLPLTTILFWLWAAGAALYLAVQAARYARFRRLTRRWSRNAENGDCAALLARTAQELGCAAPRLRVCEALTTPVLAGLARPTLLLPREDYDACALRFIFCHELCHLRSRDMLYKLALTAANAMHWFNPVVYLLLRQADEDIELCCDDAATAALDRAERVAYSETLLAAVQRKSSAVPVTTCFGSAAERLKRRITNVLGGGKKRGLLLALLVVAAAVGLCLAVSWTQSAQQEPSSTDSSFYPDMDAYALAQIKAIRETNEIRYYTQGADGAVGDEVADTEADVRVAQLESLGTLEGFAPEGTLEEWLFSYEVKPTNAEERNILTAGGAYVTDDGYLYSGMDTLLVTLHHTDGRGCEVIYSDWGNDHLDYFEGYDSVETRLADCYADYAGLDTPRYVVHDFTGGGEVENAYGTMVRDCIARRFDGEGWYLYIPETVWRVSEDGMSWTSAYYTGSYLTVTVNEDESAETAADYWQRQGKAVQKLASCWVVTQDREGYGERQYLYPAGSGHCSVWLAWEKTEDETLNEWGWSRKKQIACEQRELTAMAESFRVTAEIAAPASGAEPLSSPENSALYVWADGSTAQRVYGGYQYYVDAQGWLCRLALTDSGAAARIFELPISSTTDAPAYPALAEKDGKLFISYHVGGGFMGADYALRVDAAGYEPFAATSFAVLGETIAATNNAGAPYAGNLSLSRDGGKTWARFGDDSYCYGCVCTADETGRTVSSNGDITLMGDSLYVLGTKDIDGEAPETLVCRILLTDGTTTPLPGAAAGFRVDADGAVHPLKVD